VIGLHRRERLPVWSLTGGLRLLLLLLLLTRGLVGFVQQTAPS